MPKIQDVAQAAGVSTATVSRVFNHHPHINLEVRKRVFTTARKLNYRPRLSLKQKNVVVLTPYDPVYPVQSCVDMILMALVQKMSQRGFRLEILPTNNRERLESIQFCAAIAIGAEPSDYLDWPDRFPVPLIFMDREGPDAASNLYYVRSDEKQGMQLAIEHLHERGCRKIGCIIHGSPGTGNVDQRHTGIMQAMKTHKLPSEDSLIYFSGPGSDKYVELIGKLLKQDIDALFCPGGNAGIVSLYAFSLYNRQVPADISFIASEQKLFSQYTVPPLTAITPDYQAMAAAAAEIIETQLDGTDSPTKTVLPYTLNIRESVKPRSDTGAHHDL